MSGNVRIGQKHSRGVPGQRTVTCDGFLNIDVTSGSRNLIGPERVPAVTLSPMKLGPITDAEGNTALIFENYWQFGKMWQSAGHIDPSSGKPTDKWLAFRRKGYALAKGKRRPLPIKKYGTANRAHYNGRSYDYVHSRKAIYVPIYYRLIKDLPAIHAMREMLNSGQKIMIVDLDGPPRNSYPNGMPMTVENWRRLINDPRISFGHGYVVAALLAGLPEEVILGAEHVGGSKRSFGDSEQ